MFLVSSREMLRQ
ncbi:class II aldolase, tagatose bisphosphate family, partial [Yersinia pestis PY-36]